MTDIIKQIAALITEDPDIFYEEADLGDTGQLNTTNVRIDREKSDIDNQFERQQKEQQKMRDAEKQARIKVLKPQLDKLNKNVADLGNTMQRGTQDTEKGAQNMEDMNKNMLEIQTLLGNVSKTALQ